MREYNRLKPFLYRCSRMRTCGMAPSIYNQTVNHTEHFVDPLTGVHTSTIEGTWNGMKMHICRQHFNREFIDGALMEFIWRRRYAGDLRSSTYIFRLTVAICT